VLKFNLVHIASCNLSQKLDVNHILLSDTVETGTPCNLTILC